MRILTIIIGLLLIVGVGSVAVHNNQAATVAKKDLEKERYDRMVAEENFEKANTRLSSLEAEVSRTQNKMKATEKLVEQTKAINDELKGRLNKISEIKGSLEQKVKELENAAATTTTTVTPTPPS